MFKVSNYTIKSKLISAMIFAVLASSLLVGFTSYKQSETLVTNRLFNEELPVIMSNVQSKIQLELSLMILTAKNLAHNPLFVRNMEKGMSDEEGRWLVDELNTIKRNYELIDVSYASRKTGEYWNQNGYLRHLKRDKDAWFYRFVDSGQEVGVRDFVGKDSRLKLFINYQTVNGTVKTGLSKDLNYWKSLLRDIQIEQSGFVYLVNKDGQVKITPNSIVTDDDSLNELYGTNVAAELLSDDELTIKQIDKDGVPTVVVTNYVPSMDWFLVAEVPEKEVLSEVYSAARYVLVWTTFIAVLFALFSVYLARTIANPLVELSEVFKEMGRGESNLNHRMRVKGRDEISQVSEGFNQFIDKIHRSFKEISEASSALTSTADSVKENATISDSRSIDLQENAFKASCAINQMTTTVNEIANNASNAALNADEVKQETQQGQKVVSNSINNMNALVANTQKVSDVVSELKVSSESISDILSIIRGISEQTNLLALNAAIEAARAGEHGRGFAVVADEVRQLASRTGQSTDEIQKTIDKLQQDVTEAVSYITDNENLISEGIKGSNNISQSFKEITIQVEHLTDIAAQVATATEEQSIVVNDISNSIEEMNGSSQANAEIVTDLKDSSISLGELSNTLSALLARFKLK